MGPKKTKYEDFDYDDPFSFSESPEAANAAALAELSETDKEKRGHLANAATTHNEYTEKVSRDENWGRSINKDDGTHGYIENTEDALKAINAGFDSLAEESAGEPVPEIADESISELPGKSASELANEPSVPELVVDSASELVGESVPESAEKERRLVEVFEEGQRIHDRVKDPGNFRYRILSVAAVEMKKIEQPEDKKERTKVINGEFEKAIKNATGNEELGKYEENALAATQAYLSEILIGDDADLVSIGTTKTIVNPTGQIGKDPKIYNDLVVVRWISDNSNHVLAFSPRKDTATYLLVDDSMGESWRDRFLMAGAISGKDRDRITALNHERYDEFAHHERTFEKVVGKILGDELEELRTNDMLEPAEKAKIESSIARKLDQLAYHHGALSKKSGSESAKDSDNKIKIG